VQILEENTNKILKNSSKMRKIQRKIESVHASLGSTLSNYTPNTTMLGQTNGIRIFEENNLENSLHNNEALKLNNNRYYRHNRAQSNTPVVERENSSETTKKVPAAMRLSVLRKKLQFFKK
jgi:hypothetical protein